MEFQSTLPREERQLYVQGLLRLYDISIHAPTRGATEIHLFYSKPTNRISIHAPTRGATKCGRGNRKSCKISIHAPTRGATLHVAFCYNYITFQSTLPREERQLIIVRFKMRKVFQSTLPREERHPTPHSLTGMYYFNPRSHERSDDTPFLFQAN